MHGIVQQARYSKLFAMKMSRTVWALWFCALLIAFLVSAASLTLFMLTAGMPFETAQQIVNTLSADQEVEHFNPRVFAQIRGLSLAAGVLSFCILLAWVFRRKQSLHRVELIWNWLKTSLVTDWNQVQTLSNQNRRSWMSSLWLGVTFWIAYALIGFYLQPTFLFSKINMIFDADFPYTVPAITAWGGESGKHPLFTLFFSPFGVVFASLTGSLDSAAILVNALFGALCLFLVRETLLAFGLSPLTSILWVLVLGVSTTHLVFASLPETYIFAAAGIALIFFLLVRYPGNTLLQILAGIYTLGVTVTNIMSATIAYITGLRSAGRTAQNPLGRIALYISAVLLVSSVLNVASILLVRRGVLFFLPGVHTSDISYTTWRNPALLKSRSTLLLEDTILFNLVAARPYLTSLKTHYDLQHPHDFTTEDIELFDNGRQSFATFIPASVLQIPWPGLPAALLWILLLLLALYKLLRNRLYQSPLVTAIGFCLLFNFGFHLIFGLDVFLYSAHWTLLVVLLVAVCLAGQLPERALQGSLVLIFLSLLWNNILFIASLRQIFQL